MKIPWCISICLLSIGVLADQSVTLSWYPNPEPDIAGYVVYYGLSSRFYPNATNVGNVTTATVWGLMEDQVYYFAITAVNISGLESEFSNEVTNVFPHVIEYVTISVQESAGTTGQWTNIWSIDRAVSGTNYMYRLKIELPPNTNAVPTDADFPPITEDLPPLPTVAPFVLPLPR